VPPVDVLSISLHLDGSGSDEHRQRFIALSPRHEFTLAMSASRLQRVDVHDADGALRPERHRVPVGDDGLQPIDISAAAGSIERNRNQEGDARH